MISGSERQSHVVVIRLRVLIRLLEKTFQDMDKSDSSRSCGSLGYRRKWLCSCGG